MTFEEIQNVCRELRVHTQRINTPQYCERVIYCEDMDLWLKALTRIFGPAVKMPGDEPTQQDLVLTRPFGGITLQQTLFKFEQSADCFIAMFWPWDNNEHVTLKMACVKEISKT